MKKAILATAIVAAFSSHALAEKTSVAEVYLGAERTFWDSDRNLDDTNGITGGIEVPVTEALSLDAWLSDFEADTENGAEIDGRRYSLGGLYHLSEDSPEASFRPFVTLGGSHQEFDFGANDADETLVYLGLGAKKYFENNFILRGDLLAMNSLDNELTDLGARVALGYAFGRDDNSAGSNNDDTYQADKAADEARAKEAEAREQAAIAKAQADAKAAEQKAMLEEQQAKADAMAKDAAAQQEQAALAAQQAAQAKADQALANMDSDKDGVRDSADQCPDTNAAYAVNEQGCPIKLIEKVSIEMNVQFKTNSAEVTPNSEMEIKALADFLNQFKDTSVIVEGHTDDRGKASYNKRLSQLRADAVRAKLTEQYGVDANRIRSVGYGESNPIASNDTVEGRAANRRVVATVEANQEVIQTK